MQDFADMPAFFAQMAAIPYQTKFLSKPSSGRSYVRQLFIRVEPDAASTPLACCPEYLYDLLLAGGARVLDSRL